MIYACPFCTKPMPSGLEPATWACCGELGHAEPTKCEGCTCPPWWGDRGCYKDAQQRYADNRHERIQLGDADYHTASGDTYYDSTRGTVRISSEDERNWK